jgi:hypothetical protein
MEVVLPWAKRRFKKWRMRRELQTKRCALKTFNLICAAVDSIGDAVDDTLQRAEYSSFEECWGKSLASSQTPVNEIVMQFGFICLFAGAFPLGPLLAYLNNIIEIRIDAKKLLNSKRPRFVQRSNIGAWFLTVESISSLSVGQGGGDLTSEVITNSFMVGFSSSSLVTAVVPILPPLLNNRALISLVIAVVMEHVVFILRLIFAFAVSDEPHWVRQDLFRQEELKDFLLFNDVTASEGWAARAGLTLQTFIMSPKRTTRSRNPAPRTQTMRRL